MKSPEMILSKEIDGIGVSVDSLNIVSLSDDIVWVLHGYKTLKGKEAFNAEIENEDFAGNPTLTIDRRIEKGDSVAATGSGSVTKRGGERVQFKFSEMFTFSADAISRLETYHIWLG